MNLTYAELFAGAGGMSIGLEAAGWRCVAHAEIEPHARAVLRKQWPDVPLYGDVTQLNGADFKGITLLTGGSPCQDLSIAGKRAGMVEGSGTRSSLFFEQVRIWKESEAPLILWENVYGAFSSNNGRDFAAVLSAIVGATVAVPADGWRNSGVASGPTGIAAWRTVDAQHFGWNGNTTPQRRRRVFVLGTRTGVCNPAEVLLVADGLLGHLEKGREAREATAPATGAGATGAYPIDTSNATRTTDKDEQNRQGSGIGEDGDPSLTLTGLFTPAVLAYTPTQYAQYAEGIGTLRANGGDLGGGSESLVVTYDTAIPIQNPEMKDKGQNGLGIGNPNDPMFTLESRGHGVVTYDARGNGDGQTVNTLAGDHQNRVTDYTAVVLGTTVTGVDKQQGIVFTDTAPTLKTDLAHQMGPVVSVAMRQREGKPGGGKGPLLSEGQSLTLGTHNDQVVFPTITMGAHPAAPGLNGQDASQMAEAIMRASGIGIPRRLMPVECERLMGWPDQWTAQGIDEKGREYALSDTARYKLCGNGIASPVTAWIGLRLKLALDSQP